MLTETEKKIISHVATDLASGGHLLRDTDGWNAVYDSLGVDAERYSRVKYELIEAALNHFDWLNDDTCTAHEYTMLLYFKCCQNKDFADTLKKFEF